jgi:hypothetical protein
MQKIQGARHARRLHGRLIYDRPSRTRLCVKEVFGGDSVASEGLTVFHFPPDPVLISGKDCVDHPVIEFAIWALLQVICDGGLDAQRPFGLCACGQPRQ